MEHKSFLNIKEIVPRNVSKGKYYPCAEQDLSGKTKPINGLCNSDTNVFYTNVCWCHLVYAFRHDTEQRRGKGRRKTHISNSTVSQRSY